MTLADIRSQPRTVAAGHPNPFHESCLRSYHALNKVADLLRRGTPADVVLELIDDMMKAPEPKPGALTPEQRSRVRTRLMLAGLSHEAVRDILRSAEEAP